MIFFPNSVEHVEYSKYQGNMNNTPVEKVIRLGYIINYKLEEFWTIVVTAYTQIKKKKS